MLSRSSHFFPGHDRRFKTMRFHSIALPLFLILNAGHAGANSSVSLGQGIRISQSPNLELDGSAQHAAQGERRRREFTLPDTNSSGSGEDAAESDSARRQGRLSAEERRALRRQIDEAGQALYPPKR